MDVVLLARRELLRGWISVTPRPADPEHIRVTHVLRVRLPSGQEILDPLQSVLVEARREAPVPHVSGIVRGMQVHPFVPARSFVVRPCESIRTTAAPAATPRGAAVRACAISTFTYPLAGNAITAAATPRTTRSSFFILSAPSSRFGVSESASDLFIQGGRILTASPKPEPGREQIRSREPRSRELRRGIQRRGERRLR